MATARTASDLLASDLARSERAAVLARAEARSGGVSNLTNPSSWLLNAFGGEPTSTGARVSHDTAWNVTAYYACVDIIRKLVAMLPLRLMQRTDSGPVEVTMHNAAWLLKDKPNNFQTPFEFKSFLMACAASRGNGYARVYRDRYYEPTELLPVMPGMVQPEYVKSLRSVIYRGQVAVDAGQDHLLGSDILHVKALSTDGVIGYSPLRVLRETLGLALTYQKHTGATFANGARVPLMLTTTGGAIYTAEQMKLIRSAWEADYGGPENSAKPRILNGLEPKQIGMNNEDAELLASRKFEVEEIARFFNIPLHLLQSTEKGTTWGSGIEQMNRGTVDYMLNPWLVNLEQVLNNVLLTEDERRAQGMYFKASVQALLKGDPVARAQFYKTLTELRVLSANQIASLEDLPERDEAWANDPRTPMNGQGGGGAQPASADATETPTTEPANA